jgi:DNA-directed RNA polymerase subunit L
MPAQAVSVKGLRELNRAFARADKRLKREKNDALKDAAEPVRQDAETLAAANISRIGIPWSQMRIGVTQRVVYVAPKQRGVTSRGNARMRRPKFGTRLMDEAMQPALDADHQKVVDNLEDVLRTVSREWERG